MAKVKSAWYCTSCGNESAKWLGKCPACGQWNTMVEEPKVGKKSKTFLDKGESAPVMLKDIPLNEDNRITLGNTEIDRILGGGIVPGSIILLGGEPGIGTQSIETARGKQCRRKQRRQLHYSRGDSY